MKTTLFTLAGIFIAGVLFAQTPTTKIILKKDQKITVSSNVTISNSMAPGMDAVSTSNTENVLEVRGATDKDYMVSSTLTKLKVDLAIPGSSGAYDSEKKEDENTDLGKSLSKKLNKTIDIKLDNTTGNALIVSGTNTQKEMDEANPMQSMMQMIGDNGGEEAIVSGAFQLIPQGKKIGDSWADSSTEKDTKVKRIYTFKSNSDTGAVIHLNILSEATGTIEMMGMSVEVNTTTETNSDILFDISTGLVKKKTTEANVTGTFQLMGQSVPITAKANTESIYK